MSFGYQILGFGSGGRNYQVRYLVLAGGAGGVSTGGGSGYQGGGGGAGGYRNSFASENSGRASSTETPAVVQEGAVYTITVGAGGARSTDGNTGAHNGANSVFSGAGVSITSLGGGGTIVSSASDGYDGADGLSLIHI